MPINTGNFSKSLLPGVAKWFGDSYAEIPIQFTKLYDEFKSTKAYEEFVGQMGFGLPSEKAQGDAITYDTASQAYVTRATNKTYAKGFIITEEAYEDNQYNLALLGKRDAQALAFVMRQAKEILGHNMLNRAFNASYVFGDGKELCATDHPLFGGGTFSNELAVAADLSEASLEQMLIDIGKFTDERGNKISISARSLHFPIDLQFEAHRIVKSVLQNDSANNATNAIRDMGAFPGGIHAHNYLTDTDAYFIRTNCPNGPYYINRKETTFGADNDFATSNAMYKASFRVSFTNPDPRCWMGSAGA